MVLLQGLNELSPYVSKASRTMLVGMKFIIVIYLIYYIAIRGEEPDEVVQELTDCLEATTPMLVYKPHELLDISLDSPKVAFQIFAYTFFCLDTHKSRGLIKHPVVSFLDS